MRFERANINVGGVGGNEKVGEIINAALGSLFDGVEITTVRKISPIKRAIS
jgi:hypothetical protein